MTQTRVVLADDDVLLREGIASLLRQSSFDVVGQAGAAAGLIDLVRERSPTWSWWTSGCPRATRPRVWRRGEQRVHVGAALEEVELVHAAVAFGDAQEAELRRPCRVSDVPEV